MRCPLDNRFALVLLVLSAIVVYSFEFCMVVFLAVITAVPVRIDQHLVQDNHPLEPGIVRDQSHYVVLLSAKLQHGPPFIYGV
jgi:hypothetical protein